MWPHATRAQRPDSLRSDITEIYPDSFRLDGIRVVAGRRLTVTGGVGVVEMRLDSMSSVPIPTLEQALREMPLVRVRNNSRARLSRVCVAPPTATSRCSWTGSL